MRLQLLSALTANRVGQQAVLKLRPPDHRARSLWGISWMGGTGSNACTGWDSAGKGTFLKEGGKVAGSGVKAAVVARAMDHLRSVTMRLLGLVAGFDALGLAHLPYLSTMHAGVAAAVCSPPHRRSLQAPVCQ
jgi:hypothetical protein